VNSSYLLFDGKDSANRENNKIKTNLFYFFFRDAAYLIKIKQINVKPPNNSATFCIKTQKRHKIGFLSLFIQALPKYFPRGRYNEPTQKGGWVDLKGGMSQDDRVDDVRHKHLRRAPQSVVMPAAESRGDRQNDG